MKFSVALSGIMIAAGLATSALAQDCTRPPAPAVVNGATATEQQMIQGQQAVKDFMAATDQYLACLDSQEGLIPAEEMTQERHTEFVTKHNNAVADMEAVAAKFNQAVRDYRAANSGQ